MKEKFASNIKPKYLKSEFTSQIINQRQGNTIKIDRTEAKYKYIITNTKSK